MALGLRILIAFSVFVYSYAECMNACSSHGTCGAFDMCTCYKNFMGNDCSQRVCQFGVAHSDTAKGDLNSDSNINGPSTTVVVHDQVYPWGTTEQFPNTHAESAHSYMECSNKGLCDRTSGSCVCFDGYEGSACQRTVCPSSSSGLCSGHGICRTVEQLADLNGNNIYNLWDKKSSTGCLCDPGYTGVDCSQKICKFGVDPLYQSFPATTRYTNITYNIYATTSAAIISGTYSLIITDNFGKSWNTDPIDIAATCDTITDTIESLPNKAFPANSVLCYKWDKTTDYVEAKKNQYYSANYASHIYTAAMYTLAFPGNPGYLPEIRINIKNDGTRPTLVSDTTPSTLAWHVYADGFIGEDYDVVPDLCEGVTVTISTATSKLNIIDGTLKMLKQCLGDADGDKANNILTDVANWQTGSQTNPHLIKLVDATQTSLLDISDPLDARDYDYPKSTLCSTTTALCPNRNPPGVFAAAYFDGTDFVLLNNVGLPYELGTSGVTFKFNVFTTTGYLTKLGTFDAFQYDKAVKTTPEVQAAYLHNSIMHYQDLTNGNGTNIACSSGQTTDCLNKGDFVTFLSATVTNNPIYLNLYQVERVGIDAKSVSERSYADRDQIVLDFGVNSNFFRATTGATVANVFKFTPPSNQYNYVDECATRGLCDTASGLCQCFTGYTGDNCNTQSALAP